MWLATDRVRPPAPPSTTRSPISVAAEEPSGTGIEIEAAERLHQAKTGLGVEAERMALHHAAVAEMQPDGLGLGDQIADGQDQPVVDHHAVAGAFGAEIVGAEGVVAG